VDWWDDYARSLRRRDRSEQTADLRRSYERFWRWAIDQGLPPDPAAVSTATVNRWVDNLRETVASQTVAIYRRNLRPLLRVVGQGDRPAEPVRRG
jgi:hypothetical protein